MNLGIRSSSTETTRFESVFFNPFRNSRRTKLLNELTQRKTIVRTSDSNEIGNKKNISLPIYEAKK